MVMSFSLILLQTAIIRRASMANASNRTRAMSVTVSLDSLEKTVPTVRFYSHIYWILVTIIQLYEMV